MNIFWIITDSICNYERSDLHGIIPIYKKLKEKNEGFYFEDCVSQFPSTNLSLFSFLTGRFPYFVFPDYYRSIKNLPSLKSKNNINPLRENDYNIESILFGREQVIIFEEILNPYYDEELHKGDHWLNAMEVYQLFIKKAEEININKSNFIFVFFRPSDPQTNLFLSKIIDYLKEKDYWDNSIIIINSDHGYYDKNLYKKIKLLHFDDIHQSSMQPVLFIKLPSTLTSSPPKIIKSRVYLLDIMETILDYLNLETPHERESKSFRDLIEKDIDVNRDRKIRGDCYLMFQSIKKTMIIKGKWKLINDNGKFALYNLKEDSLEKKDVKGVHKDIYNELFQFYINTELKAYRIFKSILDTLYEQSILSSLKFEAIFIPYQFPPQLVKFLREKLKIDNTIVSYSEIKILNLNEPQKVITILIFNRLTGYGLKKLLNRHKKYTKRFIILDTEFNDVSNQIKNTGYLKFVIRSIIARRKQLLQRWKEIVVWILYFPFYFNKYLKKFYP